MNGLEKKTVETKGVDYFFGYQLEIDIERFLSIEEK